MREKIQNLLNHKWAAYTLATCSAVLLYYILSNLGVVFVAIGSAMKFISPVITGIIVAYLFNPLSEMFKEKVFGKVKKESTRHLCGVFSACACLVIVLALFLLALIPSIAKSVSNLIANWESYSSKLTELYDKLLTFMARHNIEIDLSGYKEKTDNLFKEGFSYVKDNSGKIISTIGTVSTSVSNFAVGVCFGFCFLAAKKSILMVVDNVRRAVVRSDKVDLHNEFLARIHRVFIKYIVSTLLDALIIGVSVLIFTLIMGMPYAPLIAVVCALTNIIPTFGPMIGCVTGVFFLVLDKPINTLWFLIFICTVQSLDGMIIKPKLFKGSLGIPAAWTLVLIVLGGKIAGVAGIILSIPFAAIFVIIYHEMILPRLDRREDKINDKTDASASGEPEEKEIAE